MSRHVFCCLKITISIENAILAIVVQNADGNIKVV